jgi:hypothetical protein
MLAECTRTKLKRRMVLFMLKRNWLKTEYIKKKHGADFICRKIRFILPIIPFIPFYFHGLSSRLNFGSKQAKNENPFITHNRSGRIDMHGPAAA